MAAQLQRPYLTVQLPRGRSVGGSQMWSENRVIRKCGCGPVAAFDLVQYLTEKQNRLSPSLWNREDYCREMEQIQRRYFPLLYPSGINGILLVAGLNRLFRHKRLTYHAVWAVSGKRLTERVEQMLEQDIPVILAVGPNFPFFWQKSGLSFYRRSRQGGLQPAAKVHGHYVTVLAISDEWMSISSWGAQYEISIPEYRAYVRRHSSRLFSNIVLIEKKRAE